MFLYHLFKLTASDDERKVKFFKISTWTDIIKFCLWLQNILSFCHGLYCSMVSFYNSISPGVVCSFDKAFVWATFYLFRMSLSNSEQKVAILSMACLVSPDGERQRDPAQQLNSGLPLLCLTLNCSLEYMEVWLPRKKIGPPRSKVPKEKKLYPCLLTSDCTSAEDFFIMDIKKNSFISIDKSYIIIY